jgi:hypothetical protein
MTPIQDMTLDECRDQIAVAMGWTHSKAKFNSYGGEYEGDVWLRGIAIEQPGRTSDNFRTQHPVGSLDSIAASLPPGCRWGRIGSRIAYSPEWRSEVTFQNDKYEMARVDESGEADTEILARARCCVAAWRKYKENAQ